jgi:Mg2+/Co2+ transporter CorB
MEVAMADHQIIQAVLTLLVAAELVVIQVTAVDLLLTQPEQLVLAVVVVVVLRVVLQTQHLAVVALEYWGKAPMAQAELILALMLVLVAAVVQVEQQVAPEQVDQITVVVLMEVAAAALN